MASRDAVRIILLTMSLLSLFLAGCAAGGSSHNVTTPLNESSSSNSSTVSSSTIPTNISSTTPSTATTTNVTPAQPPPSKPLVIPRVYSEQEREALASAFLTQLKTLYRQEDWRALDGLLRPEDQKNMSEDDFVFFMDVTGYPVKAQYDPFYSYLGRSWQFDRTLGTGFEVANLSFNGSEATAVVNMTYGGVQVRHQPFVLDWANGSWTVELASLLNGSTADEICADSGIGEYCFSRYAAESSDVDYCARSGRYVVACYAQFNAKVPADVAITVCDGFPTRSAADGCLIDVALSTKERTLCDAMTIPTNRYECLGIVSLDDCLATVNQSADTARTFEGMCYFGGAVATHDASLCKYVPNTDDLLKQQCLLAAS